MPSQAADPGRFSSPEKGREMIVPGLIALGLFALLAILLIA